MAFFSHQRDANARRTTSFARVPRSALLAAPIAVVATASALTVGIAQGPGSPSPRASVAGASIAAGVADPAAAETVAPEGATSTPSPAVEASPAAPGGAAPAPAAGVVPPARPDVVSRSLARVAPPVVEDKEPSLLSEKATRRAIRAADTRLWTTTELNLWSTPGENAEEVGLLESSKQILVTGREKWGRVEVVVGGRPQWVTGGYLSEEEPVPVPVPVETEAAASGLSMAPCADDGVESGLTDAAVYVFRSVCNAFPEIYDVGGYAPRGEHSGGKALDLMISDVDAGLALAEFLRTNAAELNLYNVIYRQRIFTPERGGEGWRGMEDRGSPTANHMDHVHVAAY